MKPRLLGTHSEFVRGHGFTVAERKTSSLAEHAKLLAKYATDYLALPRKGEVIFADTEIYNNDPILRIPSLEARNRRKHSLETSAKIVGQASSLLCDCTFPNESRRLEACSTMIAG